MTSKWHDMSKWNKQAPVKLSDALGLSGKGTFNAPSLTAQLPGPVGAATEQTVGPVNGTTVGNQTVVAAGNQAAAGFPASTASTAVNQAIGHAMVNAYGWGSQWPAFDKIVMAESGWNTKATNPTSGAYGIPQALPGSKMASAGTDWKTNPVTQIMWMLGYIKGRYGNPNAAWAFHQANNSY